jgi:murein DD-endopeptidase MepM/ murein hydrolase activator NlpD
MAGFSRRVNACLSSAISEKRLIIQSRGSTRYIRLTPLSQLAGGSLMLVAVGWMALATATVVIDRIAAGSGHQAVAIREAFRVRLEELAGERDRRESEARSAQARFQLAMEQVSRQQEAVLQSVEERRELSAALDLMRGRLDEAIEQRDAVTASNDRLLAQMNEVSASLSSESASGADLSDTLRAVSGALSEAVAARDAATTERAALESQVADLELKITMQRKRQDELADQLEQVLAMSFGPLESMFEKVDLDVDGLIAAVRATHSGQGGPLGTATVSTRSFDDPELGARFDQLMIGLDRMNLMRVAASKVPYAIPVDGTYRFTSGFGPRGRRMHAGIDLAAPQGTTILATADGVVVDAGRESGYGNVVRVRHEFGFETVYAHLSKIRVTVGQQVSRGVQIGDMGSTGRSTGSHLHYEVRVNGQPQNPMTYLEAAKDVF